MLSPCLFNLSAEYIMRNTGLEEAQAEIKIARRNVNNLRYADDTTLMAESEEERNWAHAPRAHALQQEKPQRGACTLQLESRE